MSFYGSIYYELVDTFYKVLVHNKGKTNIGFPVAADVKDEQTLMAIGRKGVLDIDSGNRWIKFTASPDTTKYTIWHEKPDEENVQSIASFTRLESAPEGVTPTNLYAGDVIQVSSFDYDKAGHTAKSEIRYYKLPTSTVEADIASLMSAVGDIKDIYPSKTEEDVENDEDVKNIGKAIGDIESYRLQMGEGHETYTLCNGLYDLNQIANTIGSVSEDIYDGFVWDRTFTDSFGNLRTVFPTEYSKKSLCDAIGNVELLVDANGDPLNIVQAINKTAGDNSALTGNLTVTNIAVEKHETDIGLLNDAVTAQQEKITELETKIAELEGYKALIEDYGTRIEAIEAQLQTE